MKVLIADGSPAVASRLVAAMEEIPDVEVVAPALDAQTTLGSIRAHDPDVLIVDARIPGARGIELLQSIRQEKPDMGLIILSNLVYPQSRKQYEAAGADLFMDKANEFIGLFRFVRDLVSSLHRQAGSATEDGIRRRFALIKLQVGFQLLLLIIGAASGSFYP